MKKSFFIFLALLYLSCKNKEYKYRVCDFYNSSQIENLPKQFIVHIESYHYNEVDSIAPPFFYGYLTIVDLKSTMKYNVLLFDCKLSKEKLEQANNSNQLLFQLFDSNACFEFNSSFEIPKLINNQLTTIVGRILWVVDK